MRPMTDEGIERGMLLLEQLRTHMPTLHQWRQDPLSVLKCFDIDVDPNAENAPALRNYLATLPVSGEEAETEAKCTWCKIGYSILLGGAGAVAVAAIAIIVAAAIAAAVATGGAVVPAVVAADAAADVGCFAALAALCGMTVAQLVGAIALAVAAIVEAAVLVVVEVFSGYLAEEICKEKGACA